MKQPRILILGAGGVGGYFGGRLIQAGGDVTFLVRPARHQLLQTNGLQIQSPCGDITLPVKSITQDEIKPIYDYVLLTAKAYDLDDAIKTIAPAMQQGTTLVPFLNGMTHLTHLNKTFGRENVLGGVVLIQSTLTKAGIIQHFNDSAMMFFGEQDSAPTAPISTRAQRLQTAFATAPGVKVKAQTNIESRMWAKWVLLSASAGMTCLMRANIGEIVRTSQGYAAMKQFFEDNLKLAAHYGHPLDESAITSTKQALFDKTSTATTSMLRDLENGGRVEGDHILGDLLTRANEANIDHPVLAMAYAHIQCYEQRRIAHHSKLS